MADRIGFLAPAPLTNGYTAARRFAAHLTGARDGLSRMTMVPLKSHAQIIQAASDGVIDYGVIAVENTLDGIIIESIRELERLFEAERTHRPFVCWEELLPIRHVLINQSGRFEDVQRIASHASALRQCSQFLNAVHRARPDVEIVSALSTGQGVTDALADPHLAAMASPEALEHHAPHLRPVDLGHPDLAWPHPDWITDFRSGLTRFWVLGPEAMPTGLGKRIVVRQRNQLAEVIGTREHEPQKTCYLLNLRDEAGALHRALGAFARRQISVACLFPYPRLDRVFEYLYFVEIEGHCNDLLVVEAENEINTGVLGRPTHELTCILLGSYPNTSLFQAHPAHRDAFRAAHYPTDFRWPD
jgi:chorismate mutase / prephenate dehydratase